MEGEEYHLEDSNHVEYSVFKASDNVRSVSINSPIYQQFIAKDLTPAFTYETPVLKKLDNGLPINKGCYNFLMEGQHQLWILDLGNKYESIDGAILKFDVDNLDIVAAGKVCVNEQSKLVYVNNLSAFGIPYIDNSNINTALENSGMSIQTAMELVSFSFISRFFKKKQIKKNEVKLVPNPKPIVGYTRPQSRLILGDKSYKGGLTDLQYRNFKASEIGAFQARYPQIARNIEDLGLPKGRQLEVLQQFLFLEKSFKKSPNAVNGGYVSLQKIKDGKVTNINFLVNPKMRYRIRESL